MRRLVWTGVVAVTGLFLVLGSTMQAQAGGQTDEQGAGQGKGVGQGGGRRGVAMMGAPVPPVQGIVTAASATKLTIQTAAGDSYDITVADTSRIMENRQPIKLSDIKPGDFVMAMGQVDATRKTVPAMMVSATDAATFAKAKANLGKTYITGRIDAIDADNLKLTITRMDNVTQVIAVDEGTSFQRGTRGVAADVVAAGGMETGWGFGGGRGMGGGRQGAGAQAAPPAPESITLADIKAGDSIMGTGAIKGGTFTVVKMGVSEPGAARRRGADGSTPPGSVSQGAPAPQ